MNEQFSQVAQLWQEAGEQIPRWTDVLFAAAGCYGIFLLLFGSRLVRPSLTLLGVVIGGTLGLLLPASWFGGLRVLAVIIPAVALGVIYYISWRFWIALLLAGALGLVLPWGLLVAQGQMTWDGREIEQVQTDVEGAGASAGVTGVRSLGDGESIDQAAREAAAEVARSLDTVLRKLIVAVNDWFWGLSAGVRWTVIVLGVIGTVAGLSVGLALPTFGAAMMTSFAGSMLLVAALYRLQGSVLGFAERWIPNDPGKFLIVVLVGTVIGTFVQWGWMRFSKEDGDR